MLQSYGLGIHTFIMIINSHFGSLTSAHLCIFLHLHHLTWFWTMAVQHESASAQVFLLQVFFFSNTWSFSKSHSLPLNLHVVLNVLNQTQNVHVIMKQPTKNKSITFLT